MYAFCDPCWSIGAARARHAALQARRVARRARVRLLPSPPGTLPARGGGGAVGTCARTPRHNPLPKDRLKPRIQRWARKRAIDWRNGYLGHHLRVSRSTQIVGGPVRLGVIDWVRGKSPNET